jgi:DNA-directed RNA polymerase specialized sigma24 family protein
MPRRKAPQPKNPASPFKTPEFKALRQKWYQKLERNGFKDIEVTDRRLQPDPFVESLRRYPKEFIAERQGFRETEREYLLTGQFKSRRHRDAWRMHTEGLPIAEIAKRLRVTTRAIEYILSHYRKRMRGMLV